MDDVEIDSIHSYDFRRARLSTALRWITSAAYGANIPPELREPLPLKDRDTVTAIYVNTGLVSLLINSRLYALACLNLFPQLSSTWKQDGGHWAVIQGLSRLGVYVEDDNGQVITEVELVQTNPFHLTAHVTLIEAMMTAYTQAMASTQKVVQTVKAIGPFNASEDLPIDCEDALLVWINKVSAACVRHAKGHHKQTPSSQAKASKKQASDLSHVPNIQPMEDILKDISDGCSLCALISFYCPKHLKFSDIHTTEPIGIGDSLHNICLVKAFCDSHLPLRIYHFTHEDLLYTTDTIKPSLLAFLTQLFHYFVVQPLDIVSPPIISNNNDYTQGVKTIPPPSTAATKSNQSAFTPISANQHVNGPQDLISNVTKKSFQHSSPTSSRLSNHSDFGSNPSLNTSARLLHKRSTQASESPGMHDTLSPIVVRKSQSMGILNSADPKQSLVAWESKSYYIDRSSKPANRVSNGSPSLLSNVSFSEEAEEDETKTSAAANSSNTGSSVNEFQRRQPRGRTSERPKSSCNMSYQTLLDRSNDLESPLKLFAQKHGFQLSDRSPAAGGDEAKSLSPVDMTSTDLTKVTPRSDSELSPRLHSSAERRNGASMTGQSYVISTALTAEGANAAGIPIIQDHVDESCTDVTFTSLVDNIDSDKSAQSSPRVAADDVTDFTNGQSTESPRERAGSTRERAQSPIQPIELFDGNTGRSSVTSFVGLGMSKTADSTEQSVDFSAAARTPPTGLKHRFEQQKAMPQEAKSSKKTTFSLNQTTWSDHAKNKTASEADSDTQSETSEASGDRKPFSDVKILLEEKRKAMEKKKTLEDIERAKEVDNTSRQAFLKAVAKNRNTQEQNNNKSSEALKAFSRNDISKSIESLQSKWQQDEISSAKRVAATTTSAKSINVTAAPLDNITEVTESMEVESPSVPLPSAQAAEETAAGGKARRSSSIDMHEAPVDVQQYGLDKLNESLTELRGEMRRLSHEQKRIEELQTVMNSRPQSRSTPSRKSTHSEATLDTSPSVQAAFATPPSVQAALDTPPSVQSTLDTPPSAQTNTAQAIGVAKHDTSSQHTLHLSDLENTATPSHVTEQEADSTNNNVSMSKSYNGEGERFSRPSSHSMVQSTEEPFVLHKPSKVNKSVDKRKSKVKSGDETVGSAKNSARETVRRSSNGFLSSSQLSRKKVEKTESPAIPVSTTSTDQSAGRRKWSADSTPLFPGYDDDVQRGTVKPREPSVQEKQPIFQPPPDISTPHRTSQKTKRSSNRLQFDSFEDSPMREAQQKLGSDTLEIQQLPGRQLPVNLSMEDTPMRESRKGSSPARREVPQPDRQQFRPIYDDVIDTPMRDGHAYGAQDDVNADAHGPADISGIAPMQRTPPSALQQNLSLDMPSGGNMQSLSQDTPMRQPFYHNEPRQYTSYDDTIDTPMRQRPSHTDQLDTPMLSHQRPQSMIETYNSGQLYGGSIDTPLREAMRSKQIFYSPPTRDVNTEPVELDNSAPSANSEPRAVSRHGTTAIPPHTTSRHGSLPTDHPLGSSANSPMLVKAPYEFVPTTTAAGPTSTYKLNTPYGNADNEIKPAETNISLSSAMDAIRNDMIKQHSTDPVPNSNLPFGMLSQTNHSQPPISEPAQPLVNQAYKPNLGQGQSRRVSSGSSDMENAFADIASNHSHTSAPANPPQDSAHARASSAENEDRASVHSYGSGSLESAEGTPRSSGKPKRATWDMSTPRGDLLNQPGVGFIVAEQAQPSEEELRKRKEKVMMMQLKRREEQEQKKQQKVAELAAKVEAARMKDQESERRKLEEKVKKEAILQQFQFRKAEEDLPPEMRANYRQKQKRTERPASIHWAGSSADEHMLRGSDNIDTATSFTVSLGSGNLTHRRPISPANSAAAGSLSSRSKASSRPTFEAPSDEYTGPKLYVKPSSKQKSNRTIIINAVSHCCLAGVVNTDNKNKVLEEIARSDGKHFLILFRDGNQTYKAVYSYEPDSEECTKVHGQGPKYIKDDMCHRFYKYNSGGKKFTEVLSTKHLSVSIDAITIHNHLWQKKTAAVSARR